MLTTKAVGEEGEARALAHLQRAGLELVERNYRVARGPRSRGGEIDLVVRARDGTLVFVEVRKRGAGAAYGGAAASVSAAKQRSLVLAAQHYLRRYAAPPACRFDVVAIDGERLEWLQGAFDAA
jgi:putative endonuclease